VYSAAVIWSMARALAGSWLRGFPAAVVFWLVGELMVNMEIMPSGSFALAILAWMVAANVLLAARVRQMLDRRHLAGVPRNEQLSTMTLQLFIAGAAALVLGLVFEAMVYGLMEYFGIVNPYFCIIAFGVSFISFWLAYAVSGNAPEPQT